MHGQHQRGERIDGQHPLPAALQRAACAGGDDPRAMLRIAELFGDLADNAGLVDGVGIWLRALHGSGVLRTLALASDELGLQIVDARCCGLGIWRGEVRWGR